MGAHFTHPHPALRPYIQGYLLMDIQVGTKPIDLHPTGCNALSFVLNEKQVFDHKDFDYNFRLGHNGYICEYTSFRPLAPSVKMILIPFTPAGMYRLFSIPQQGLANQLLPLEEVIPGARDLSSRLEDIGTLGQAIRLIQAWLLQQIPHGGDNHYNTSRIEYACQRIKSHHGMIRIKDLCRDTGMSQTALEDHFKQMVGISPKLYSRIVRFMAVHQFICRHAQVEWSDLVHRYNYFDQSHFIREFKTFFGYTPSKIHTTNHRIAQSIIQIT